MTQKRAIEIQPGVFCSPFVSDGKLMRCYHSNITTTHAAFCNGIQLSNNGPCLGTRTGADLEYEWISYQQVYDMAQQFGSAMLYQGIQATNDNNIGVFAVNSPQWVIVEKATAMFSMVVVALYPTYTVQLCAYVVEQSETALVVCDTATRVQTLLEACATIKHRLRFIVMIDKETDGINMQLADQLSIKVISFTHMLDLGRRNLHEPVTPSPSDIATICYTSGTTGIPKGAVLTHENLISNIAGVVQQTNFSTLTPEDVYMSYLPLPHMYERVVQCMMYHFGCRVGFYRGDIKFLMEDLQTLKPTFFSAVPRLLNRIYDKVLLGVHSSILKTVIFNVALRRKTALVEKGVVTRDSIWDKLVFGKVQSSLGGRIRFTLVGSAPLSPAVMTFTRCALGCEVYEGYGQTEFTAAVTITVPEEKTSGHVGGVIPSALLKVVDVPEMGYFAKDRQGEVCCKGTSMMSGYYKEPEKTKDVIDEDGWLHTGDIGIIREDGTLKVIDRKKGIFKLSRGEYVSAEMLENIFVRSSLIGQIFIDGNSQQDLPIGVVVPDAEVIPLWAAECGINYTNMEEICRNENLKIAIMDDIKKLSEEAKLKTYEKV